jgi:hypothetical protein
MGEVSRWTAPRASRAARSPFDREVQITKFPISNGDTVTFLVCGPRPDHGYVAVQNLTTPQATSIGSTRARGSHWRGRPPNGSSKEYRPTFRIPARCDLPSVRRWDTGLKLRSHDLNRDQHPGFVRRPNQRVRFLPVDSHCAVGRLHLAAAGKRSKSRDRSTTPFF